MQFKNIAFLVLVAVSYVACQMDTPSTAPPPTPLTEAEQAAKAQQTRKMAARHACRQVITRMLHDPDSADWVPGYEWPVSVSGERVTVRPSLRANNAFGGKVAKTFTCVVDMSSGKRKVISVE